RRSGAARCNPISLASSLQKASGMERRFVYALQNVNEPDRHYVGLTSDPVRRLEWHNAGRCSHTAKSRPWKLAVSIEFPDESRAIAFEKYLKSGSGRAFAKRHFE